MAAAKGAVMAGKGAQGRQRQTTTEQPPDPMGVKSHQDSIFRIVTFATPLCPVAPTGRFGQGR